MKRTIHFLWIIAILAALASLAPVPIALAADQVVNNCSNDSELRTDLTTMQNGGGGMLTFNCGTVTITLGSQLPEIKTNTTIDGGGKITLSGLSAVRLFNVSIVGSLRLNNIVLERGYNGGGDGGAIYSTGNLTLTDTTIQNSYAARGGAIYTTRQLDITNSTLAHNIAQNGGAIYVDALNAELTINDSKFDDNSAASTGSAGAIYILGALSITDSEFVNNNAGSGGAILAAGLAATTTASIMSSTFHDNKATGAFPIGNGGAVLVDNLATTISDSILRDNVGQSGGAIYVLPQGSLSVMNSTVKDNQSTNGGGIYNRGGAVLSNVTVSGNSAFHGGGINNFGTLTLSNVTLSGNSGTYGGGLKNEGAGSAALTNVTLSNNSGAGDSGGGIFHSGANAQLYLRNVIAANSPTGGNCDFNKAPNTVSFSLSSDATCNFGAGRDNVAMLLGPLANNGGVTQTHLPQLGSPAIDNGTAANAPATDQRGIARPQSVAFDVGAVEVACAKPAKPTLVSPENGKKAQGPAVALDWADSFCAESYKVKIKLGSSAGSIAQKKGGLTASEFTTKPLTKGQTYAWQVTAVNAVGKTKSEWRTFIVK